ncbi:MAG: S8/S53 family peptidase [Ktedonobacteraceae bacterium]|nr:S8/S53 family peptidase [Ktedonobacteraceae bacterium]MBO0790973.1 S8/S53 family peptidase [Ktedonobacteraceae bacterium]
MSYSSDQFMGTPEGLYHWVPGEMVVIIRVPSLPADDTLDVLVEQVQVQLNTFLAQYGLALELYGTAGRWHASPAMPPVRRRAFVFALHRKQPLVALFFHTRHADAGDLDPLPRALSYLQSHLEHLAQQGLYIISAMPNWLVTAAPVYFAEGGPAVPPRPSPSLDVPAAANSLTGWRTRLLDQSIPLDSREAEEVLVAVLDTAPHPDRVRSAASRPELRRNWLLQRLAQDLRNEDGGFVIEYDRYALTNDTATGRDNSSDSRYYLMSDHGLAVAGLVRDMAPRVRIRLVRILNDFGGGDLYSLFAALTDLERELVTGGIRRLVINLSLTIMPDIRRLPYIWFDHRQWPTTQLMGAIRVLNHIEEGLRLLFEALLAHGALVVAAAGNDSLGATQQGQPPRPPRSPARYETTLSVTSVNSRFSPSNFANSANVPPSMAGVATFGGDGYGMLDANGLPDAVRGVYISPVFPGGEQNVTGWADWCGSSLAAPIISGLSAHLMAQGWSAANVITRFSAGQERRGGSLYGAAPDAPGLLANIVRVQQRFGL